MITCVDIFIELGAETVNIIINLWIKRDPGEGGAGGGGGGGKNVLPGSDHHRSMVDHVSRNDWFLRVSDEVLSMNIALLYLMK